MTDRIKKIAEQTALDICLNSSWHWGLAAQRVLIDNIERALIRYRDDTQIESQPAAAKYRLVYNKITKKIDKVRQFDGLTVESFDPPTDCGL